MAGLRLGAGGWAGTTLSGALPPPTALERFAGEACTTWMRRAGRAATVRAAPRDGAATVRRVRAAPASFACGRVRSAGFATAEAAARVTLEAAATGFASATRFAGAAVTALTVV